MATRRARPGNPLLAVALLRVSTEDQNLGPEAQRAAVSAWAKRSGVTVVAWFEDHGVSGAAPIDARPGLLGALDALKAHGAGVLVAAKRDRIARDTMLAAMVERMALAAGAVVRTADGASDATGPEGIMMRGIVDVFSAYERAVIQARTRSALAVKRARGERTGEVPFGHSADEEGKLTPNAAEQSVIAAVRELRGAGVPLRAIVARLEAAGLVSPRSGRPLALTQVARIAKAAAA